MTKRKKRLVGSVSITAVALVLLGILAYRLDIFYQAVDRDTVKAVHLNIDGLLSIDSLSVVIEEPDSIQAVITIEKTIRKVDGTNRYLKAAPWTIKITYLFQDEQREQRTYVGQMHFELEEEFVKIPEMAAQLNENRHAAEASTTSIGL